MPFEKVCQLSNVPAEGSLGVEIQGVPVAIVRDSADEVHAIYNVCSHEEVELSEGEVDDGEIECWLHGSRFDLKSGEPTGLPATEPVPVYPCKLDGDNILVDVHNPTNALSNPGATPDLERLSTPGGDPGPRKDPT